ncbi:MAG: hypothetical protein HYY63_02960, partial [Elusimicrobia bacterium]|nr:hypothetical protein [Elusimicrobiota bacterium]
MMKRLAVLFSVGLFGFSGLASAVPAESRIFTPYFNMSMMQGAFLPTKGNFFAGANVGMSVGLLSRITEKHAIFALYNLGFSGEGFRFPDTKEFASKELSHNFNGEYRWDLFDWLRIRPGASYGTNFTRTAAGEIWGSGLYDSKVYGGSLALDYKFGLFGQNATLTGQGVYRVLDFPNYTDIIREFKGLSSNTELAGTLKDQKGMEANASFAWSRFFSRIRYAITTYDNEKVVESNGTYGTRAQEDTKVILEGGFKAKL